MKRFTHQPNGSGVSKLVTTVLIVPRYPVTPCTKAIVDGLVERNADLARERIGMFLEVEDRRPVVPSPVAHWWQEAEANRPVAVETAS